VARPINLPELWHLSSKGDEAAYACLYNTLFTDLYNYLSYITEEDVAQDALQELFTKLWISRHRIGKIGNVRAYCYQCARAIISNHYRNVQIRNKRLRDYTEPSVTVSPEEVITAAEEADAKRQQLTEALRHLPKRQREIIHLRYYRNMDYSEIAHHTGIKYQSVINHNFRALQNIKGVFNRIKLK
jgi:RNA polymerase sigma factor (sigma-70 family)